MNGMMYQKTKNNHTYIIAEVGQNHNGDIELAKNLIDIAAVKVGHYGNIFQADAVKFCKRDLNEELTEDAWNMSYLPDCGDDQCMKDRIVINNTAFCYSGCNKNKKSYGITYGEHRQKLELSYEDHAELFLYTKKKGLDFVETVCSPGALRILKWFRPDFIKIASRDIDNIPLLLAIAETEIPVIISTGMSGWKEIKHAVDMITIYHKDITILHCISQYPARYENINFMSIEFLKKMFPDHVIGYSDHTTGVLAPSVAVAYGAKVIEKHITFDRNAKGTDHAGSMDIGGFERVIRDVRNTELARGTFIKNKPDGIEKTEQKLRRSICTNRDIKKGEKIYLDDLVMLSPGTGISPYNLDEVIGKTAIRNIKANSIINKEDIS